MQRCGLDTNILLPLAHRSHPQHGLVTEALRKATTREVKFCFAPQNVGEFWNVSTRPIDRNGFGLSPEKVSREVQSIERRFTLLPEEARVYETWMRFLRTHDVRGVQVHDAHLAAILEVHKVRHLLTFNGRDFARYSPLIAIHPADL